MDKPKRIVFLCNPFFVIHLSKQPLRPVAGVFLFLYLCPILFPKKITDMAHYLNDISRTFSEYLLIPGLTTKECIPNQISLKTPLVNSKRTKLQHFLSTSRLYRPSCNPYRIIKWLFPLHATVAFRLSSDHSPLNRKPIWCVRLKNTKQDS